MFLRFNRSLFAVLMVVAGIFSVSAQVLQRQKPDQPKPTAKPAPTPDPKIAAAKPATAEQVIETGLFVYGLGGGRTLLNQIRKTTLERGKSTFTAADGKIDQATYQRFVIRADKLDKEKIRLDQDFTNARYALVYSDEKIFGVFNSSVFTPREDASRAFENQIVHGLDALLRYKENESKVELAAREKVMGVDYFVIDVTDKKDRKTRYYVSAKTFRVMMLTYEEIGVKYRCKFYNYNYAQGTLVPYRTVLWANDKIIEETNIGTVTFGQKVDEEIFKAG